MSLSQINFHQTQGGPPNLCRRLLGQPDEPLTPPAARQFLIGSRLQLPSHRDIARVRDTRRRGDIRQAASAPTASTDLPPSGAAKLGRKCPFLFNLASRSSPRTGEQRVVVICATGNGHPSLFPGDAGLPRDEQLQQRQSARCTSRAGCHLSQVRCGSIPRRNVMRRPWRLHLHEWGF